MEIDDLKKARCPEDVIAHCEAVYRKAIKISAYFDNVDMDLIRAGALLHDIGRSKTHGIMHAVEGAKIARELGYSEKVCNIIERHIGAGISEDEARELGLPVKSYIPQTLEEKIVAHSDNLVSRTEEVDIDFVVRKIRRKVDNPEKKISRLILLHNELRQK